ncbi:HDL471Wp [Eremothecium sinecaudum]|uniref:Pre-mRNA-splicing factor CWC24 n=1 Tax=Eremothecium sinecaudum TaxID=45286 RepID=A0A0X8HRW8_9SACH|nr:HDL471Wp [Eremothecium sinecaudum]AMD20273.1 HDL471Wp [Eremothecium sinecaudum]
MTFKKRTIKGRDQKKADLSKTKEDEFDFENKGEVLIKKRKTLTLQGIKDNNDDKEDIKDDKVNKNEHTSSEIASKLDDVLTVGNEDMEHAYKRDIEKRLGGGIEFTAPGKTASVAGVQKKIITDYQPDVCKDFKQTGYCGYGDSCKFLHSRDDFKAGWKLNEEWRVEDLAREKLEKELEKIPFRCVICKGEYKSPVETNCHHYFCSSCFMKRSKSTTKCAICGQETQGVMKSATKLKKLLAEQVS